MVTRKALGDECMTEEEVLLWDATKSLDLSRLPQKTLPTGLRNLTFGDNVGKVVMACILASASSLPFSSLACLPPIPWWSATSLLEYAYVYSQGPGQASLFLRASSCLGRCGCIEP